MAEKYEIDIVIPWVDGDDPEWIKEFNSYAPKDKQRNLDYSSERFRDFGLLKYWFRGVEKFAPWVRKIHFITCGQKPDWLDTNKPKLNWVKHEDYIPKEYLPVFSSHPIELCINKIPDLAEHFIYFNDDLYLTAPVSPNFFFRNGKPCDYAVLNAFSYWNIIGIVAQDISIINRRFSKREVIKKNFFKWFNPKYGKYLMRNILLLPWSNFTFFFDGHMSQAYKKSNINEVWDYASEKIGETLKSRFRNDRDINMWLCRYWQLCKGDFYPVKPLKGTARYLLSDETNKICRAIQNPKIIEVILNDTLEGVLTKEELNFKMDEIINSFEKILPEKSSFEL